MSKVFVLHIWTCLQGLMKNTVRTPNIEYGASRTHAQRDNVKTVYPIELAPSPYYFVQSICLAYMNMFARFDENPAMSLQDILRKQNVMDGGTHGRTHTHGLTDMKTVYPLQTKIAERYKNWSTWSGYYVKLRAPFSWHRIWYPFIT